MKHFLLTLLLTFIVGVCSAQTEHKIGRAHV